MTDFSDRTTDSYLDILRQLEAAAVNHTAWLKGLYRVMICGSEPDAADLETDAYCHCRFGQWYYSEDCHDLRTDPAFIKIGECHEAMHTSAGELLQTRYGGQAVPVEIYDAFMDLSIRLRQDIASYQLDIINTLCIVDHLTGAWNRTGMSKKLQEEHERMVRGKKECCVCMMDLDHFKLVNDTYGHCAGDSVLAEATKFISGQLRKYDSIFRYGGEEFLICLPDITIENAMLRLEHIRAGLAALPIPVKGQNDIYVSASFGLTNMAVAETIDDTIRKADHALLCAKAKGRNQVCQWTF
ncbi:MAG: diguanylate cyclase [Sulfuricellaceae bacterium]|nr:diguanylate cyclase [Sulfuricellaceae bacterium]